MPNKDLKDKHYHTGDGNTEKYTTLAMRESRLNKAKEQCQKTGDCSEFEKLGGDSELTKLEGLIHKAQDTNHSVKKTGMDAGRENEFIKTHSKDKDNANPTGLGGIPKINKGSIKNKIMTNKEVYNEQITKEISEIRYLIEYMDNNNNKQKL